MKVLLCKGRFAGPISGSDETLVAYATQLKAAGLDVSVAVVFPHLDDDPYYLRLRGAGVRVFCIAQHSVLGRMIQWLKKRVPHLPEQSRRFLQKAAHAASMQYVARCRAYIKRSSPDVIHVMTPDPAVMAMIRAAHDERVPVLYQELGTPEFLPELAVYYEQLSEVLPLCSEIAALSPALARGFSGRLAYPSSLSVLPIMVNEAEDAAGARNGADGVTFGFASRMEYGKGPLSLLQAFARMRLSVSGASLRMAGDGPQRLEAADSARAAGLSAACTFTGTYSGPAERSAFLRSIDVFVLPSLAEGTPNCVIEAMAHGVPVIATSVGGIPDTVSPEMAILVPPGDVAALAAAMTELATSAARRAAMGRAARARYEALFSPGTVLPLLTQTYRRLAGRTGGERAAHPWASGGDDVQS
jgi:glycosyltransferase involved in cell wall biosynthesis